MLFCDIIQKQNMRFCYEFDEVQLWPLARQAIKFLVKDHRYDYIETGSLISIKKMLRIYLKKDNDIICLPVYMTQFL